MAAAVAVLVVAKLVQKRVCCGLNWRLPCHSVAVTCCCCWSKTRSRYRIALISGFVRTGEGSAAVAAATAVVGAESSCLWSHRAVHVVVATAAAVMVAATVTPNAAVQLEVASHR